jgi:hypothetical protein
LGPLTPYTVWGLWTELLALGIALLGWLVCRIWNEPTG